MGTGKKKCLRLLPHDRTLFDVTSGETGSKITYKSGLYSYHIAINLKENPQLPDVFSCELNFIKGSGVYIV